MLYLRPGMIYEYLACAVRINIKNFNGMKIVADRDIPFLQGVLEPFAEVVYLPGKEISVSHLKDADALLTRTRNHMQWEITVRYSR